MWTPADRSGWRTRVGSAAGSASPAFLFSVGVLDANGNEILRIGQYGNVEDGLPLVREGGPPSPRSIGGDEVGLMHPQMLAAESDRRLFVSDLGNARIASVKLEYRAEEKVALRNVPNQTGNERRTGP